MKSIFAAALVSIVAGCSSTAITNTAPLSYVTVSPELAASVSGVSAVAAAPAGSVALGSVKSQACQRLTSDPLPTAEYAIALLKQEVLRLGGNALTDVKVSNSAVSIQGNCWASIRVEGVALKL